MSAAERTSGSEDATGAAASESDAGPGGAGGALGPLRQLPDSVGPPVPDRPLLPAKLPPVTLRGATVTLQPYSLEDAPGLYDAGCGAPFMGAAPYDADAAVWRSVCTLEGPSVLSLPALFGLPYVV